MYIINRQKVGPNNFGLWNAPEIRKITKYQDLKNEVKRAWKWKKAEIVPVIVGATGMIKETLTEYLKIIPGNITPNELHVEAVRGSVKILKRALGTKLWERSFTVWFMNHDPLPKNRRWRFWYLGKLPPTSWNPQIEITTNVKPIYTYFVTFQTKNLLLKWFRVD